MSSGQSLGDGDIIATPGECDDSRASTTRNSSTSYVRLGSLTGDGKFTSDVRRLPVFQSRMAPGTVRYTVAVRLPLAPSPDLIRPRLVYHLEWHPFPSYYFSMGPQRRLTAAGARMPQSTIVPGSCMPDLVASAASWRSPHRFYCLK